MPAAFAAACVVLKEQLPKADGRKGCCKSARFSGGFYLHALGLTSSVLEKNWMIDENSGDFFRSQNTVTLTDTLLCWLHFSNPQLAS